MERVKIKDVNLQFAYPLSTRPRTDKAVVHHFGQIPAGRDPATIDANYVNDLHITDRKWAGVAYHYIIRLDGTIEQGRPDWAMGAHDAGENANSLGILVVGDFRTQYSRPQQVLSLVRLYADLCEKYQWPALERLEGHCDNEPPETPTECPGKNLYEILPWVRRIAWEMVRL
jgi:N-acetylmuramoyl-L-alanine amidase